MLVLGLTTATPRGGVAIVDGDRVLARAVYVELRSHAEKLFAGIDEVCARAGVERAQLVGVACDIGPGSFTGVRVGVSAATGIALALRIPAIGVLSLEALATAALEDIGVAAYVVVAIDAQKSETYLGRYRALSGGEVEQEEEPVVVSHERAKELLAEAKSRGDVVAGAAAAQLGVEPTRRSDALDFPDAGVIARIAARRLALEPTAGRIDRTNATSPTLVPVYVRPPDITMPRAGGVQGPPPDRTE